MRGLDFDLFEMARYHFDAIIEEGGWEVLSDADILERMDAIVRGHLFYQGRQKMIRYLRANLGQRGRDADGELLAPETASIVAEDSVWASIELPDDDVAALQALFAPKPRLLHAVPTPAEVDPGEETSRALIDQLIAETQLYSSSDALKELFAFTARLRNMAPFNAMILHVQKPGLSYAMTAKDWRERYGRFPKPGVRPLVILRNFGPVDFVFDVQDTEGRDLPEAAFSFPTAGTVPSGFMRYAEWQMKEERFELLWLDQGDRSAGYARRLASEGKEGAPVPFRIAVNRNHPVATQVVTLVHELAHVFLGHCGPDPARKIKPYRPAEVALREIEAESVAYVIAKRSGLSPRSESYLDTYQGSFADLDVHRVLTCANRVERLLDMPFNRKGVM
ncbi:ImmA/IrrE family metallo-endopeptidase [Tranquillimonas alkanivorans]|uniref:Uncharacterized protein n=1 Tax=Tranquillimonas alkanivorans TaxID=441119 RepID=A0A1I5VHA3_9RHOB|nr:ImmA/IrrE family metallo-endopeptidase [Tranquillimonas alkanivorans]SFQ06875.1 protein of unknown function [Tranquillimonas alkanivorans]